MNKNKLHTDKIVKGKRTYFFDIKKSEQADLYLTISEKKKTDNTSEHHRVMIFEEDLKDFVDTFRNALLKFKELQQPKTEEKKYSIEKIRATPQNAYQPWTEEDDEKLELLFCEGKKVKELTHIFERKEGAITSRIKKLELKEKYGR
ncbi:PUR family DNA/RNA-binding protein [Flavobacterium sp. CBA20B-1]|uniref:PUR family DNA/RNA-binding protein n=1 Tax=unclassified Flavobacterium TaxID=196869 RepID=UPI00222539E3|nr:MULTISPECIES: PUR family DNA/RNA-binding protein [unclassified Flavobacterium]WCM41038.1 PUR family DNA/RNA-binding protein [Flavobacterium sp. CBA20B-1]